MGRIALIVVTTGTIKVGDIILCRQYWGRVRALVNDRGERQDAFGQFEALLPTRAVRPGDRWQARDFWGTWARSFPAPAPKLRSVRAACAYRGADDRVATIRVEILVETFEGPWALAGDLAYDLAAGMLVRVELKGTGKGFRQELTAERALLDR